jgi:hypothetical protein
MEYWMDKEGEEPLFEKEMAGVVITPAEEDSSLVTPVPSNRSDRSPSLCSTWCRTPPRPRSNRTIDKEGYCARSGGSDLELVPPCRDGAGQAARTSHHLQ